MLKDLFKKKTVEIEDVSAFERISTFVLMSIGWYQIYIWIGQFIVWFVNWIYYDRFEKSEKNFKD